MRKKPRTNALNMTLVIGKGLVLIWSLQMEQTFRTAFLVLSFINPCFVLFISLLVVDYFLFSETVRRMYSKSSLYNLSYNIVFI